MQISKQTNEKKKYMVSKYILVFVSTIVVIIIIILLLFLGLEIRVECE